MGALKTFSDRLLGRGSAALTVPPMDGALKPNNRLEEAAAGIAAQEPLALAVKTARWCGRKASNYGQRLAL